MFKIDDIDKPLISKYNWRITHNGYLITRIYLKGGTRKKPLYKDIRMHRLIMNAQKGQIIDHINRDKTDNRRKNLRFATKSQNAANSYRKDKGICWHGLAKKWMARIQVNGQGIYLGVYSDKEKALGAYRLASIKYFGEYAR